MTSSHLLRIREHDEMSQPPSSSSVVLTETASPTLPVLTQAAATHNVQDGIIVTDFAEKRENISSPTPKTVWVPPHLRGKARAPQPSAESHVGLSDGVTKSLRDGLTKTVEASSENLSTSSQTTPGPQLFSQPETFDKGLISAATEISPSLAEIGQSLLRSSVNLESNGYLNAETITSPYVVHGIDQAQLGGTAQESTGDYCLPAKTYKDPSRPIQKHLVTSDAMADDQVNKKAKAETPLTIQTDVPNAVVLGSGSDTPASGSSAPGLRSANFRKILAATSASTDDSPVATPSTLSSEKLRSESTSKVSVFAPSTPDLAPPPSNKISATTIDTGVKLAANGPVEKARNISPTPATAAASKATRTAVVSKDTEDRQDQTWFSSWGKRKERDRPCGWTSISLFMPTDVPND